MIDPALLFTADAHEAGAVLVVKDINGNLTDVKIRLKGVHSEAWRKMVNRRDIMSVVTEEVMTPEMMFAKVTIGWEGMPNPAEPGSALEFNEENAVMMYTKSPLIFEQVNRFIANHANFIQGSESK